MSQFLETLRLRAEEAQNRLQEAAKKFQAAQIEHQMAAQQFNSWNTAYQAELAREQGNVGPHLQNATTVTVATPNHPHQPSPHHEDTEINKTEIVRNLLRQNPAGITPNDLWKAVNAQIAHRPYLYSILKRLSDRGDVYKRRGKYFPKLASKGDEQKDEAVIQ